MAMSERMANWLVHIGTGLVGFFIGWFFNAIVSALGG